MSTDFLGAVPVDGTATVAAAGTAVPLAPVVAGFPNVLAFSVTITGVKNRTTANTGNVLIGATKAANAQRTILAPGAQLTLTAPIHHQLDLSTIFVDAINNGDGVAFIGLQQANS